MIKSFQKMFAILSLFSMDRTSLAISEIEEELGYPKSTVFRILNTLENGEFIVKNQDNHRYSLGHQFFRLGTIFQNQLDFRAVALPIMRELAAETSETIELNIMDELSRVCIEKIDSTLTVRNFVRVGEHQPIHLGASGKILLAFQSETGRERILSILEKELGKQKQQKLREDLMKIREKGYAFTKGERVPGSFAIAAPLFDVFGETIASVTLAGPIQRLSEERENLLIQLLTNSAKEISKRLGYVQPK